MSFCCDGHRFIVDRRIHITGDHGCVYICYCQKHDECGCDSCYPYVFPSASAAPMLFMYRFLRSFIRYLRIMRSRWFLTAIICRYAICLRGLCFMLCIFQRVIQRLESVQHFIGLLQLTLSALSGRLHQAVRRFFVPNHGAIILFISGISRHAVRH